MSKVTPQMVKVSIGLWSAETLIFYRNVIYLYWVIISIMMPLKNAGGV